MFRLLCSTRHQWTSIHSMKTRGMVSFREDMNQFYPFIRNKLSKDRYWVALSITLTVVGSSWLYARHQDRVAHHDQFMSSTERRRREAEAAFAGHATSHHGQEEKSHPAPSSSSSEAPSHNEMPGMLSPPTPIAVVSTIDSTLASTPESISSSNESLVDASAGTKAGTNQTIGMEPISVPYLLIGGGAASFAAMEAIHMKDPQAQILLVSSEPYVPYKRPPLTKELWFNDDSTLRRELQYRDWNGKDASLYFLPASSFDALPDGEQQFLVSENPFKVILGKAVVSLDPKERIATLDDGRQIHYQKALLATGGQPNTLAVLRGSGMEQHKLLAHVSSLRGVADFLHLDSLARQGGSIAIVGGGFLGSELACALAHISKNEMHPTEKPLSVYQIFSEDGNMGNVFPRYLSRWTSSRLEHEGVHVMSNSQVSNISMAPQSDASPDPKVVLEINGGEKTLAVDHVVLAVGISPNDQLASNAGLAINEHQIIGAFGGKGGILANEYLQVAPHHYTAGDVAAFKDLLLGLRRVEHFDHALASGRAAGTNMALEMAGEATEPYTYQSMFWSDLGPEVSYEAVGTIDNSLNTVGVWARKQHASLADETEKMTQAGPFGKGLVFYTKEDQVVGILMFNLRNRVPLAREILCQKKSIQDVKELVEQFQIHSN